jgi:Protein of unknown function (DUF3558)
MKVHRLLVVAIVIGTLAACTSETVGSPSTQNTRRSSSPAPGTTTSTSTTTSRSPERSLPPRPRDLDLTGVDPCKDVLTRDQLRRLVYDLGYLDKPIATRSVINGGPACTYASQFPPDQPSRGIGSLVVISTSEGAEVWLTEARKPSPDKYRLTSIVGFPALVMPHPVLLDDCAVVVDVHAGQYLQVNSNPTHRQVNGPAEPYCAEAQRVAGMVMETLLARR